jgi:hypothetical protein
MEMGAKSKAAMRERSDPPLARNRPETVGHPRVRVKGAATRQVYSVEGADNVI